MRRPGKSATSCAGALAAGAVLLLLAPAATSADPRSDLRAKSRDLAAQERAALVELYAIETRLAGARRELEQIRRRAAALDAVRASAGRRLEAARRTLAVAERQLGEQLRLLYEQDQPSLFEVILGATSLEEIITGIDSLSRAAESTSRVVEQAREARRRVGLLTRTLDARRAELRRLRAQAEERAAALVAAQRDRAALVSRLRSERRLTLSKIAELEARARAAQARAEIETVKAEAAPSVASLGVLAPQPQEPTAEDAAQPTQTEAGPVVEAQALPPRGTRRLTVMSTGYALRGTTATGLPVGPGIVAVDPTVIPLGTRMTVPGYGEGVAADTGPAIKGLRIDLWFPTRKEALAWGWRTVTVTLHP